MKQVTLMCLIAGAVSVGCDRGPKGGSSLKIDYGIEINNQSPNTAPAVVWVGNCSATIVSDNTLVTAAHCVAQFPVQPDGSRQGDLCIYSGDSAGKCATKIYIPPQYNDAEPLKMAYDIAVGVFPAGTFKQYHVLETVKPKVGDALMYTGYSPFKDGVDIKAEPTKRWGINTIDRFLSNITIVSEGCDSFDCISVSPGDSGGPAFHECKLLGVASRMATPDVGSKASLHTNVTFSGLQPWLAEISKKNGYLCGLSGMDEARCSSQQQVKKIAGASKQTYPCAVETASTNPTAPDNNVAPTLPDQNPTNPPSTGNPTTNPNANKCSCGVEKNQHGAGCVVKRFSTDAGKAKIFTQSGSDAFCKTETLCLEKFGDYLKDSYFCPAGWFFAK